MLYMNLIWLFEPVRLKSLDGVSAKLDSNETLVTLYFKVSLLQGNYNYNLNIE